MILNKDGKPMRRLVGFHQSELQEDASEASAVSGSFLSAQFEGEWRDGGGEAAHQEPFAKK